MAGRDVVLNVPDLVGALVFRALGADAAHGQRERERACSSFACREEEIRDAGDSIPPGDGGR
jgi:hypothetical protein